MTRDVPSDRLWFGAPATDRAPAPVCIAERRRLIQGIRRARRYGGRSAAYERPAHGPIRPGKHPDDTGCELRSRQQLG